MSTVDANDPVAHCPKCGAEYRAGFDTCADDGTELLPGPAPEQQPERPAWAVETPRDAYQDHPGTPDPVQMIDPIPVHRTDEQTAYLIVGRLQALGIPALMVATNEKQLSPMLAITGWALAPVYYDVLVRRQDAPKAKRLLEEFPGTTEEQTHAEEGRDRDE